MSRATITRAWSAAEEAEADRIVDFILGYGGDVVGAWLIAQRLGYNNPRTSGRRKVYDLMPLATMRCAENHKGHSLVVLKEQGGDLYRVTTNPVLAKQSAMPRIRHINTKVLRLQGEIEALRLDTADLGSVYMTSVVDQMAALVSSIAPTLDMINATQDTTP